MEQDPADAPATDAVASSDDYGQSGAEARSAKDEQEPDAQAQGVTL